MTASPTCRVPKVRSARRPKATTSWKIVWAFSHSPVSALRIRSSTANLNFVHGRSSFVVPSVGSVAIRPARFASNVFPTAPVLPGDTPVPLAGAPHLRRAPATSTSSRVRRRAQGQQGGHAAQARDPLRDRWVHPAGHDQEVGVIAGEVAAVDRFMVSDPVP
jgi:hypothetical protein